MGRPRTDRADRTPAGQAALKKETDVERHLLDHWGGTSPPAADVSDGDIPFGGDSAVMVRVLVPATQSVLDCNWARHETGAPTGW